MDDRTRQWLDEMTIDGPTKKWTEPDTVALRGVRSDLARVTAERDAAVAIIDLFIEIETVAATDALLAFGLFGLYVDAMEKACALRARKVGG